jgi:hypothetical protein
MVTAICARPFCGASNQLNTIYRGCARRRWQVAKRLPEPFAKRLYALRPVMQAVAVDSQRSLRRQGSAGRPAARRLTWTLQQTSAAHSGGDARLSSPKRRPRVPRPGDAASATYRPRRLPRSLAPDPARPWPPARGDHTAGNALKVTCSTPRRGADTAHERDRDRGQRLHAENRTAPAAADAVHIRRRLQHRRPAPRTWSPPISPATSDFSSSRVHAIFRDHQRPITSTCEAGGDIGSSTAATSGSAAATHGRRPPAGRRCWPRTSAPASHWAPTIPECVTEVTADEQLRR